jgi:hypothetical protein
LVTELIEVVAEAPSVVASAPLNVWLCAAPVNVCAWLAAVPLKVWLWVFSSPVKVWLWEEGVPVNVGWLTFPRGTYVISC